MTRICAALFAVLVIAGTSLLYAGKKENLKMHTVEIRSYNLKPGTRARFHQIATEQALPMLKRARIDVVALGPSLHDDNSYFLIRNFSSVEDRQRAEDSFYNSDEWKQGPREAVLGCIESYTTVVVEMDDATLAGLRKLSTTPAGGK